MPRRSDHSQGRLELSFYDRPIPGPGDGASSGDGRPPAAKRSDTEPPSRPRPRPRRHPVNRPVRGEQDLPVPAHGGEWRIDVTTRLAGRSGVARARAALAAVSAQGDRKVDAA